MTARSASAPRTPAGAAPGRTERGSGSVLMVGVMAVIMMLAVGAICIAGYLVAGRRARAAADLAALSGAVAVSRGGDGCAAARANARRNNASVIACDVVGDQIDFVVTVTAEVEVVAMMRGLPTRVRALAYGGPVTNG